MADDSADDFGSLESQLLSREDSFKDGDHIICKKLYDLHREAVTSKAEDEDIQCQRILRFSSGWWGSDPKTAFEGKGKNMKLTKFRQTLVLKTMEWFGLSDVLLELNDKIEGPGICFFQHKTIPCLRFVCQSSFVVNTVQSLILGALSGTAEFSPIIATFLCSQARDWGFYFRFHADLQMLDNYENEAILEHNSLWPTGLNVQLNLTATTLPDIRRLCAKYSWPPTAAARKPSVKYDSILQQKPIPLEDISYTLFKRFIIDLKDKTLERFANEVKSFHDVVKTLKSRFNSFEDEDADNLDYVCAVHKEMIDRRNNSRRLAIKRDLCFKSGWWGLNVDTAIYPFNEKFFKLPMLVSSLAEKARKWYDPEKETLQSLTKKIQGPGVYVFQHKVYPQFRFVGQSDDVLGTVRSLIFKSLVGTCDNFGLAAMLLSTRADDWYFYFMIVDDPLERDIKLNDLIILHDALWPHGINRDFVMNAETLPKLRASCVKHSWPKDRDSNVILPLPSLVSSDDDINALRETSRPASGAQANPDDSSTVDGETEEDGRVSRQSRSTRPRESDSPGGFTADTSSPSSRFPPSEFDDLEVSAVDYVAQQLSAQALMA